MNQAADTDLRRLNPFSKPRGLAAGVGEAVLTLDERQAISRRLGANMLGAGVLGIGILIEHGSAEQIEVAYLIQAAAAFIVSAGVFRRALSGFFAKPTRDFTEQLVALAVFAAMAAGDFVSAALVPLLLEIGHLFEERSALGARDAIERLQNLCTRNATVLIDAEEKIVSSREIECGAQLIVRPGEVIAADGVIRSGHASIDQSPVTGESIPKDVDPGDNVYAGTINQNGLLTIDVEKAGGNTVLGEVIRVLQEVEGSKTPIVRMLERAAAYYLPVVITLATIVLFLSGELSRFVTVLVVACPCALVLAAPAAMVASMSTATKESILIKNAAFLETAALVDTLVLDKTGTITEGTQSVDEITSFRDQTERDVLRMAAAAAHGSRHPASRAILVEASKRNLTTPNVESIQEFPGKGVESIRNGVAIRIGRASWLKERGVIGPMENGSTGVWVAKDRQVVGFVSLSDRSRIDARDAIEEMRALGFSRTILLTGDKSEVAHRIAEQLDLDDVFAEVLPTEKLEVVRREQAAGRRVLMVGDGINDALALSAADVGIAVGAEMNDVALGGADVAILANDLRRLPYTVRLANQTRQIIVENVAIGLTFSVGMLTLATLGLINPLAGALFHNAGAIFVVLNSSRLLERNGAVAAADSEDNGQSTAGNSTEQNVTSDEVGRPRLAKPKGVRGTVNNVEGTL
ncbi:MAG: cation-translocating P-type ATPase [Pseudomonadota bacterium]